MAPEEAQGRAVHTMRWRAGCEVELLRGVPAGVPGAVSGEESRREGARMTGPCSMCVHFSMPETVDAKLRAGGWGVCALGSDLAGHYQSQAAACQFVPARFALREIPPGAESPMRAEQPAPCDLPEEIDFG